MWKWKNISLIFIIAFIIPAGLSYSLMPPEEVTWDFNKITDAHGITYRTNGNGVITINEDRYVAFALRGKVNGNEFIRTSLDFDWNWNIAVYNDGYIATGTSNYSDFVWKQKYYFNDSGTKLENTLTNDLVNMEDVHMYYIFTVENGDVLSFNDNYYIYNGQEIHLKQDFSDMEQFKLYFKGDFMFDFQDIIDEGFTVDEFYVGPGSYFDRPELNIVAIGFTKGSGNFPKGSSVTIDPTFSTADTSNMAIAPLSEHEVVLYIGLEASDERAYYVYDTNGTEIIGKTNVGDGANPTRGHNDADVGCWDDNTTCTFAWYDDNNYLLEAQTWNVLTQTNTTPVILLNNTCDNDNTAVGGVEILTSSKCVVSWAGCPTGGTLGFATLDKNGTITVGPKRVVATGTMVETGLTSMNSSDIILVWSSTNISAAAYNAITGVQKIAPTDLQYPSGSSGRKVKAVSTNSTHWFIGYWDDTGDSLHVVGMNYSGSEFAEIWEKITLESNTAGGGRGIMPFKISPTKFGVVTFVDGDTDVNVSTFYVNGTVIAAGTLVDGTAQNEAPAGISMRTDGSGICNESFVLIWENATTATDFGTFLADTTAWDGVCPAGVGGDVTAPTYSLNSTNSTRADSYVKHNLYWTENVALSGYIFSFDNGVGSYTNDTWASMVGVGNWSNVTKMVIKTNASTVKWKVYTNDSSNNWNVSGEYTYTAIDTWETFNITACQVLYETTSTYQLTADITNHDAYGCFNITDDNIIFNGLGHIIDGNDLVDIAILHAENTNGTVKNFIITDFGGSMFAGGDNCTYSNITISSSVETIYVGIRDATVWFYLLKNSTATNITVTDSIGDGMYVQDCDGTTFEDIISTGNSKHGFIVGSQTTTDSTYSNMNLSGNTYSGLNLLVSCNSTFSNIEMTGNNAAGINVTGYGNTIYSSTFKDNPYGSVWFRSNPFPNGPVNKFYNNLFNDSTYINYTGNIMSTEWNTTSQAGTRIKGAGTNIGGNYYTNSTGNGYSDDCLDADDDGFCDTAYEVGGLSNNTDSLPLTQAQKYISQSITVHYTGAGWHTPSSVVSLSKEAPSHLGNYSIDDNLSTYWASTKNLDESWIIYDLGQIKNVDKIRHYINTSGHDPAIENFNITGIYVSKLSDSWGSSLGSVDSTTFDEWVETDITNKVGRYIKLQYVNTDQDGLWFYGMISEFDYYVSDDGPMVSRLIGFGLDIPGIITLGNTLTKLRHIPVLISQTISLTNSVKRLVDFYRSISQSITLTSVLTRLKNIPVIISQNITLTTTLSRIISFFRSLVQSLTLTPTATTSSAEYGILAPRSSYILVDDNTYWSNNITVIGSSTVTYNIPLGFDDLNVTNSTGINITFTNTSTSVSFTATDTEDPYNVTFIHESVDEVATPSCPVGQVDYGFYCRDSSFEADRKNYYYTQYINATFDDVSGYPVYYNITGRFDFVSVAGMVVDTLTVNDTSVSGSVVGGYYQILINNTVKSLTTGVYEVKFYYHVPSTVAPPGGGGGGYTLPPEEEIPPEILPNITHPFYVSPGTISNFMTPGKEYVETVFIINRNEFPISVRAFFECAEEEEACEWSTFLVNGNVFSDLNVTVTSGTVASPTNYEITVVTRVPDEEERTYESHRFNVYFESGEGDGYLGRALPYDLTPISKIPIIGLIIYTIVQFSAKNYIPFKIPVPILGDGIYGYHFWILLGIALIVFIIVKLIKFNRGSKK